jgi:transcription antitermination factor NusG
MFALTDGKDLSGISRGDLRSFHRADLVISVTDEQDRPSYVAVEMSYTADERDTTRAIRNAEYLERFTGQPARAAIAGLRRDRRIEDIDPGEVFWYELPESILDS